MASIFTVFAKQKFKINDQAMTEKRDERVYEPKTYKNENNSKEENPIKSNANNSSIKHRHRHIQLWTQAKHPNGFDYKRSEDHYESSEDSYESSEESYESSEESYYDELGNILVTSVLFSIINTNSHLF